MTLNNKDTEIENRIRDTPNLAFKALINIKATENENKIPDAIICILTPEVNRFRKKVLT